MSYRSNVTRDIHCLPLLVFVWCFTGTRVDQALVAKCKREA